jgi:hypothetical protein
MSEATSGVEPADNEDIRPTVDPGQRRLRYALYYNRPDDGLLPRDAEEKAMLSTAGQQQCIPAFKMMERLGIDPGGAVVPRLGLLYTTASHRCGSCPSKRACSDWLAQAPESVRFAPPFCPNSDILAELQFSNLGTPC